MEVVVVGSMLYSSTTFTLCVNDYNHLCAQTAHFANQQRNPQLFWHELTCLIASQYLFQLSTFVDA